MHRFLFLAALAFFCTLRCRAQQPKIRKGHQWIGSKLGHERLWILSRLEHGHAHMRIEDASAVDPFSARTTVVLEIPLKVRQSA